MMRPIAVVDAAINLVGAVRCLMSQTQTREAQSFRAHDIPAVRHGFPSELSTVGCIVAAVAAYFTRTTAHCDVHGPFTTIAGL